MRDSLFSYELFALKKAFFSILENMRDSLFSYELFALKKAFFSILENMHNSLLIVAIFGGSNKSRLFVPQ